MNLQEFDHTERRTPLLRPSGAPPRAGGRTRKAAEEGATSPTAIAANVSPGGTSANDHDHDNGAGAPVVAVNFSADELFDAMLLGSERRLDLAPPPLTAQAELAELVFSGLAVHHYALPAAEGRFSVQVTQAGTAHLLHGTEEADVPRALIGLAGMLLHPHAAKVPQKGGRFVGGLNAWGEAYARGFLAEEPYAMGRMLRSYLEIDNSLDPETAAQALLEHHGGVISAEAKSELSHRYFIDWPIGWSTAGAMLSEPGFALTTCAAVRFYCPHAPDPTDTPRITIPTAAADAWAHRFAAGFLGVEEGNTNG